MTDHASERLFRTALPDGTSAFSRRTGRRQFGLNAYEAHVGPVFELAYADRAPLRAAEVDPEGELSAAEVDRLLAERPGMLLRDSRVTWWATRAAAEAEALRLLDRADPRLSDDGRDDPIALACTRRDATAVWWETGDGDVLWRVEAEVRERREVVEREGGVVAVLRRATPNDRGVVASLSLAAADGTHFRTTEILPDGSLRRGGADGFRAYDERAQEPALVARACARASELGEDVAAAVAAALARGAVTAYPMGDE